MLVNLVILGALAAWVCGSETVKGWICWEQGRAG